MLELPECKVLADQINKTLKGNKIVDVVAGYSPHKFAFFYGDPADYKERLLHQHILNATAFGPFCEVELDDVCILFGDGTNCRYLDPLMPIPKKHQLLLSFENQSKLVCSIQMYGAVYAYPKGALENEYYESAKSKPSILSKEFTLDYFMNIVSHVSLKTSVKELLATHQRIPGLGNGVFQDIAFGAMLHPKRKIQSLSNEQFELLYHVSVSTMKKIYEQGGRDTEKDLFGNPGGYKTILSSKTYKNPCPICGGTLHRQPYLGGNIYFCENCQPL